jgi:PAS domain S-box-containing protein
MQKLLDYLLLLLSQFFGGPGPEENNLVRFGLPAILWAILLVVAWTRQRRYHLPRERLLVWGFGLGLLRELFMFGHMSARIITGSDHDTLCIIAEPIEHALSLASMAVVAAAFLRYILDDEELGRLYVRVGAALAAGSYLFTFWFWGQTVLANPEIRFHSTWYAWLFHSAASLVLAIAIFLLVRQRGWLRNVIVLALGLFFVSEALILVNFATERVYCFYICPIGNALHILAIPVLGYVYLQEQSIERDRAEHARRESEERYRSFVHNFEGIAFRQTLDLDPIFLHGAVRRITGYSAESLVSGRLRWDALVHPEDRSARNDQLAALRTVPGYLGELEYRIIHKDGDIRWVREQTRNQPGADGRPAYIQGAIYDITDHLRAQRELAAYRDQLEELVGERTSELTQVNRQLQQEIVERIEAEVSLEKLSHQTELILNSAGEGVFGVDVEGRHTFVNRAAARMLGFTAQELIGKPSHQTWHHSRPDGLPYPENECPLHIGYKTGIVRRGDDEVFWRQDGTPFPVRYTSTPIFEKDKLVGAVVIFQDITDRKRSQAEIARRNAELAGQNAIAATLSQSLDLNTILRDALARVLELVDMDAGGVYLLEESGATMILRAHQGGAPFDSGQEAIRQLPVDGGLPGLAVTAGHPVVLDVGDVSEQFPESPIGKSFPTVVVTPLLSKGWVIGAMTLGSRRARPVASEVLDLLASIGQQMGLAVENAHLYEQTQRWAAGLAQLHRASLALTSSLETDIIYDQITEQAARLLECQVANLYLWDADREEAVGISSFGVTGMGARGLRLTPTDSLIFQELVTNRRTIAIRNARTDPRVAPGSRERFHIEAGLALPLLIHDRLLGFLFVIDQRGPRLWQAAEIDWAESLVNHASIALEIAFLYQKAEQAAALEERQRIAAEMHDGLAQTLSYLGLKTDQAAVKIAAGLEQEAVDELNRIRAAIGQASQEVRQSIASLRESPRTRRPLQHWLADVVGEFSTNGGVPVSLDCNDASPVHLPPAHMEQVLRVVQEALLNAGRHARASRIKVRLDQRDDEAMITVADDGQGFDPQQVGAEGAMRFGLNIMRARAARLRGELQINSRPGQGTEVLLRWPLRVGPLIIPLPEPEQPDEDDGSSARPSAEPEA